ncbi:tetratricopeptide repeat-containing sulfotransferase family protein [Sphingomonas alpina]|uniref:Sulfotransferase n=1 Tax=Sphingomonas alpina TaxID=653931 RepID=A0A7H0LMY8_9SPHN|nr:tetratricopeptide repeat-containing sulfotransferase family protein [Sphingomonas alpina]QNQ11041.1 sulfotransferase [Sphingomonas alpina]
MVKSDGTDLRGACEEARLRVAADPRDEAAAQMLFEAVSQAGHIAATRRSKATYAIAPQVAEATRLLEKDSVEEAEILLRHYLTLVRNDPDAMLLMANIAGRSGFPENAEKILRRSVELHPGRADNWMALAQVLHEEAKKLDRVTLVDEALACLDRALAIDPTHEEALGYKAALLVQIRRLDAARQAFEELVAAFPESPPGWVNFAHLLKTLGFFGEAVAAYRTAIALDPANGTAWWLFADLKLARFFPADIHRMEDALQRSMPDAGRINLHFALAAAYDQAGDYAPAADHWRRGNGLRLDLRPHDMEAMQCGIDAAIQTYTSQFFVKRSDVGEPSPDPIFIIGLPRSGSTLLEQILSSHSRIEGTAELFAVQQIEMELFRQQESISIENIVEDLDPADFRKLGNRYLELTRFHRRTDRARFIDKNPGNWRQVGLIHMMLPNARIIDIRRNPLDCCFANYTQHFMVGVNYSYGFTEIASQYREYVRLMRHFDRVLPGRVHRVIYEDLVENVEAEVRALLDHLALPFEESCLRFFETDRPIHTPSSEQVRQPINRAGIGRVGKYEPWVGELRNALGTLVEDWRDQR